MKRTLDPREAYSEIVAGGVASWWVRTPEGGEISLCLGRKGWACLSIMSIKTLSGWRELLVHGPAHLWFELLVGDTSSQGLDSGLILDRSQAVADAM